MVVCALLCKEHKRAAAVHRGKADLQPCDDLEQRTVIQLNYAVSFSTLEYLIQIGEQQHCGVKYVKDVAKISMCRI